MLTYSFANIGSESLYVHLYNCIKNDIISGNLVPGFKLPSKRSFAKNLGISVITVENAYAQLMAEGYIYSIAKKGYFVSEMNIVKNSDIAPYKPEGDVKSELYADLVSNSTLYTLFPFATWAKLLREVISERSKELMRVPPCSGTMDLREAIAKHLFEFRGLKVNAEQIVIGAGTEYLYGLIIKLFGYDKVFAVENPGYKKIAKIYESSAVECRYIGMDSYGVRTEELLKSGANVLHISPSHHFPTGIVMPISRRYELLSWAADKADRYIIEDDYDSEFRLIGRAVPPIKSIDVTDKVIYMNTFTKSLASTVRISYMVLPKALTERFYKQLGFYSCTVSTFEQYTLAEFISGGFFENHINRMRKYYKNIRDGVLEAIKRDEILKNAKIEEENSGLHFLLRVNTKLSDGELKRAVLRNGVRISCLSDYYSGTDEVPSSVLIVNYSNIDAEKIPKIISKISTALKLAQK